MSIKWFQFVKKSSPFIGKNRLKSHPHRYYIGGAEGHEYPDLQVGDEVNPRPVFMFS